MDPPPPAGAPEPAAAHDSLVFPPHVLQWDVDAVCVHVAAASPQVQAAALAALRKNDIDGALLPDVDQNALIECGIASWGQRRHILRAIHALRVPREHAADAVPDGSERPDGSASSDDGGDDSSCSSASQALAPPTSVSSIVASSEGKATSERNEEDDTRTLEDSVRTRAPSPQMASSATTMLSDDTINNIVDEEHRKLNTQWERDRLPKLQQSKYFLFNETDDRRKKRDELTKQCELLDLRLQKFLDMMKRSQPTRESEVRDAFRGMVTTVYAKNDMNFYRNLLDGPEPDPPTTMPSQVATITAQSLKMPAISLNFEGANNELQDESISNSDENGNVDEVRGSLDGFIVHDTPSPTSPTSAIGDASAWSEDDETPRTDVFAATRRPRTIGVAEDTVSEEADTMSPRQDANHRPVIVISSGESTDRESNDDTDSDSGDTDDDDDFDSHSEASSKSTSETEHVYSDATSVVQAIKSFLHGLQSMSKSEIKHWIDKTKHALQTLSIRCVRKHEAAMTRDPRILAIRLLLSPSVLTTTSAISKLGVSSTFVNMVQDMYYAQTCHTSTAKRSRARSPNDFSNNADNDTQTPPPAKRARRENSDCDEFDDEDVDAASLTLSRAVIAKRDARRRRELEIMARSRRQQRGVAEGNIVVNAGHGNSERPIYVDERLVQHLKPHQVAGLQFVWKNMFLIEEENCGAILAHYCGLGKTLTMVALLHTLALEVLRENDRVTSLLGATFRVLVLAPAPLVENWQKEFVKWMSSESEIDEVLGGLYVMTGVKKSVRVRVLQHWRDYGGVVVMSYETFSRDMCAPDAHEYKDILVNSASLLVCDEAHRLKNPVTKTAETVSAIKTPLRIALTGTPLQNNLLEYYTLLRLVTGQDIFGDTAEFNEFVRPIEEANYEDADAFTLRTARRAMYAFQRTIEPYVHRLDASTLAQFLPPKTEIDIVVPLTDVQRAIYCAYLGTYAKNRGIFAIVGDMLRLCSDPRILLTAIQGAIEAKPLDDTSGASVTKSRDAESMSDEEREERPSGSLPELVALAKRIRERFSSVEGLPGYSTRMSHKTTVIMELIMRITARKEKCLVFSNYLGTLDFYQEQLEALDIQFKRIDGMISMHKRTRLIREFNEDDEHYVFLISIKACAEGVDLQRATHVIIVEPFWVPTAVDQAIGRAYRFGQTRPVTVYRFSSWDTLEAKVERLMSLKGVRSEKAVDGKNASQSFKRGQNTVAQFYTTPDPSPCRLTDFDVDLVRDKFGTSSVVSEVVCKLRDCLSVVCERPRPGDPFEIKDPEELQEAKGYLQQRRSSMLKNKAGSAASTAADNAAR